MVAADLVVQADPAVLAAQEELVVQEERAERLVPADLVVLEVHEAKAEQADQVDQVVTAEAVAVVAAVLAGMDRVLGLIHIVQSYM